MNGRQALSTVLRFFSGFLGAMAATAAVGFAVLATLTTAAPQWNVKWSMAGAAQKTLWIALPTVVLLGGGTLLLWRKHRATAVGVLVYMVVDATVVIIGR